MPIISVEIMKAVDERNSKKNKKRKKEWKKGAMGTEARVKGWELNDFVVHLS